MIEHSETDVRRRGILKAALPLPLIFAATVIVSFFIFSGRSSGNEKTLCDGVGFHASEEVAGSVVRFIETGSILKTALDNNPYLEKVSIAWLSSKILDSQSFIIGVSTAPSAIVKYHFPESGNEALIGHDLLSNPERREALTQAAELKAPVVSGPFESVDGGNVLFVRYPVFTGDKLWGFVSLTVDFEAMIESFGLEKHYPGFSFAFSETSDGDSTGAGNDPRQENRFLAGTKEVYAKGISRKLNLPGKVWRIHVMPSRGWTIVDPFLFILLAAGLTGAIVLFAVFYSKTKKSDSARKDSIAMKGGPVRQKALSAFEAAVREARDIDPERQTQRRATPTPSVSALSESAPAAPIQTAPPGLPQGTGSGEKNLESTVHEDPRSESFADAEDLDAEKHRAFSLEERGAVDSGHENAVERETVRDEKANAPIDLPRRQGREVKFKGPDVKGQLYMPDVLFSGDPSTLFAKPAEEKAMAQAPAQPKQEASPAHTEASATQRRQEFLFSLEEEPKKKELAILVVDDSEANRDIMGRMLSLRGYRADFAASGDEALSLCETRRYTIIFMDCFMPDMDGYRTTSLLRVKYPDSMSTIVGMSARMGDQEIERCKSAGMNDLLMKPFTLKDLLAHIEKQR